MKKDNVDLIIEQWKREIPNLNTSSMAVLGRLNRAVKYMEKQTAQNFSKYGLNSGEFDVLATLRRSGGEYKLKPTELYQSLMITSGAITNRIDTLEKKGLVIRSHDKKDRRTVFVQLTKEGIELISNAVWTHVETEDSLLLSLTQEEIKELDKILKKMLEGMEKER